MHRWYFELFTFSRGACASLGIPQAYPTDGPVPSRVYNNTCSVRRPVAPKSCVPAQQTQTLDSFSLSDLSASAFVGSRGNYAYQFSPRIVRLAKRAFQPQKALKLSRFAEKSKQRKNMMSNEEVHDCNFSLVRAARPRLFEDTRAKGKGALSIIMQPHLIVVRASEWVSSSTTYDVNADRIKGKTRGEVFG